MATDSKLETTIALIATKLADITAGSTYHYTVDKVRRVDAYHKSLFEPVQGSTMYFLRVGTERETEMTAREISAQVELFLMLAHRDERVSEDDFTPDSPITGTIRNRLIKDAKRRVRQIFFEDFNGLGMDNLEVTDVDHVVYMDGWVLAQLGLLITYSYHWDQP